MLCRRITIMLIIILFICLQKSDGVTVNESQYALLPTLYHLDPYQPCIDHPGGVYCSVKFNLVSDEPNALYTMIQEHAARTTKHFNYTELQHGICLTKTCREYYQQNTTEDLNVVLEGCLNESLWRECNLKAKVFENVTCIIKDDYIPIDASDITVGVVIAILLVLTIIASFLEFYNGAGGARNCQQGFVSCFSLPRNWKKLVAPAGEGPETRNTLFKGFFGFRSITMLTIIMIHSVLTFCIDVDNPRYIEEVYDTPTRLLFVYAALVIHYFFIMSGFLLTYNFQLDAETSLFTWTVLPRRTLNRWLRLTPVYAVVLALTATWIRHAGTGPLWQIAVAAESEDCRRHWWRHLLYINNYFDDSRCMPQTWYLAADIQLHIVGMAACVLSGRHRRSVLALLTVAAILMPAAHTYFQDLDALLLCSPEASRNQFFKDATFNHTYKRGHTNLAGFLVGMMLALAVYHWQETHYKFLNIMKQRYIYWLTFPGILAVLSLGCIFYTDGPRVSVYLRAAFAGLVRPVFSGIVALQIIGMVFKFENIYRSILEWDGWKVTSRISYCAYVIHLSIIRLINGTRTTLVHASVLHLLEILSSSVVISLLAAIPLHLLVEAPLQNVVNWAIRGARGTKKTPAIDLNYDEAKTDDKVTSVIND